MQKNRQYLRRLCLGGLLVALSIVFGKLLAFNIGELFRISFENLPIVLAGIALGPLWGALVGAVADLVGCLIVGYTVNPFITLGAIAIGAVSGVVFKLWSTNTQAKVFLTVAMSHICGSILIKTAGLSWFYGTDFFMLLFSRCANYALIIALEYTIIYILIKNKSIREILSRLGGEKL